MLPPPSAVHAATCEKGLAHRQTATGSTACQTFILEIYLLPLAREGGAIQSRLTAGRRRVGARGKLRLPARLRIRSCGR
jgi:hypothetical protein